MSSSESAVRSETTVTPGSAGTTDRWGLAAILALCAFFIVMRWTKMDALFNGDPPMWLNQVARFARGEVPYRDFANLYPPLTIFLLGSVARLFGATFAVIQTAMDLISLAIVLLAWQLVRHLLSPSIRVVTIAALVVINATTLTMFNLFSFSTYSPALEIAAIGLLLVLIGGVRQLERGASSAANFWLIAGGVFIATISKPESTLAAWGALLLLWWMDRAARWRWYARICLVAGIAGATVYALVGHLVGFSQLKTGISGYGMATFACPWWPTGYGVFGAAACTGEAVFVAAVLLWPFWRKLEPGALRFARRLQAAGCVGLLLFAAYVWYQCGYVLSSAVPISVKIEALERSVIWTSPALLPVMWASICLWIGLVFSFRRLAMGSRIMCFVLAVPVLMSARGLFGSTLLPHTDVAALCFPFFVIIAAYLIQSFYSRMLVAGVPAATIAIVFLLGGYSLARLIVAYPKQLSDKSYYALQTRAGRVLLSDDHTSERIYSYIVNHTNAGDELLDIPYGGGFNFAAQMPSPVFTTMFKQLRTPKPYQQLDLEGVRSNSPKLVVADPGVHFETTFGYRANMACAFPRLVWAPDQPSWDPNYVFPAIQYLEQNYHVVTQIGSQIILAANRSAQ